MADEKIYKTDPVAPIRSRNDIVTSRVVDVESVQHSTVNWRAIFAGAFVSLITYLILMTLGLAIGGGNLQGVIEGQDTARGLGIGTGIWLVVSILVSLFVGAYTAGQVSGMIPTRIGRTQGVVVAALFFFLILSQVGSAIGSLGRGVGAMVGAVGGAAGDLAQNPQVQNMVDDAIGDLNLRSSPETVIKGLATRLVRGDDQSAINYLSRQTGISQVEAQQRLTSLKQDVQRAATEAGTQGAQAMKMAGWTLFGALLLGVLAAMIGGGIGARGNLRAPLSRTDERAIRDSRAA